MPARDMIHEAVKNAIIKDGWHITADPYDLSFAELSLSVDLAAEKFIEAVRDNHKILIEVKSFVGRSFAKDFQAALGQYQMYLGLMEANHIPDKLYIALSDVVYRRFFDRKVYAMLIERYQMRLLIVDVEKEEVVSWIS